MGSDDTIPTPDEAREQLRRILDSDTLVTRRKLRNLLKRLVEDSLNGTLGGRDYERRLGIEALELPKNWNPKHNNVRKALSDLRDELTAYYSTEGSGNRVGIEFPPRAGFAPRFSYRPDNDAEESVQRLAAAFTQTFPDVYRCVDIVVHLEAVIAKHPSYAPTYAVYAEVLLACAMCDETHGFAVPKTLSRADEAVKTGMGLNKELWHLYVVAGAIYCCRFAWADAEAAFKTALRLAPRETRSHFWYWAYLIAVHNTTEEVQEPSGMELTRLTPYRRPLIYYVTRRFEDAYRDLISLSRYYGYLVNDPDCKAGRKIIPLDEWLGKVLMSCVCISMSYHYGRLASLYAGSGGRGSTVGAFNGLCVLAAMKYAFLEPGIVPYAGSRLGWMEGEERPWQSPVSLALAYMGVGRKDEAVAQLEQACDMGHPLMVWLHLWPIFDPLREREDFKGLIRRMNLP
jgi:tetratricopeptide (TPR) repeat protein